MFKINFVIFPLIISKLLPNSHCYWRLLLPSRNSTITAVYKIISKEFHTALSHNFQGGSLAWYLLNFGGTATRQSYSGHTNNDQNPGTSNELTPCECNVTIMHFLTLNLLVWRQIFYRKWSTGIWRWGYRIWGNRSTKNLLLSP